MARISPTTRWSWVPCPRALLAAVRQWDGMWVGEELLAGPGSTSALLALRSQKQGRWGTGCGRGSTCQTHVRGGPRQLHTRLGTGQHGTQLRATLYTALSSPPGPCICESRMGGSHAHLPPPKNKCIYMYVDI